MFTSQTETNSTGRCGWGAGSGALSQLSTLTQYSSSRLALFLPVSSWLQTTHVYSLLTSDCLNHGSHGPRRPAWRRSEARHKRTTTVWWQVFCVLGTGGGWDLMNAECRSKLSGAAIYILVCFTVVLQYDSVDCWDAEDHFPVWRGSHRRGSKDPKIFFFFFFW